MLRWVGVVLVVVLVNLPWVNEAWVSHRLDSSGRDVTARVVGHSSLKGTNLIKYRLPRSADPQQKSWSARIDDAEYHRAVAAGRIRVRVVPGSPAESRPVGEVGSALYAVAAIVGDSILVLVALAVWLRRRRWSVRRVVEVDGDLVTFEMAHLRLTARSIDVPAAPGDSVRGWLALRAESDVTGSAAVIGGPAHLGDARYRITGRLVSVAADRVRVRLEGGFVLPVLLEDNACRAGAREPAEVTGRLELSRRPEPAVRRTA